MKSTKPIDSLINNGELSEIELKILSYIHHSGPAFAKKLAARLDTDVQTVHKHIMTLQSKGYLERVARTMVEYRINRRNKVTKHRNHTYYDLTRKGRLFMRHFQDKVEVNLRPPYKQA
jgi:predicted transcriptional regulator